MGVDLRDALVTAAVLAGLFTLGRGLDQIVARLGKIEQHLEEMNARARSSKARWRLGDGDEGDREAVTAEEE